MIYIYLDHKVFWDIGYELYLQLKKKYNNKVMIINKIDNNLDGHIVVMFGLNDYTGIIPSKYICVQLEQYLQSNWFNDTYINYISNALQVYEYSYLNYQLLNHLNPNYIMMPIMYCKSLDNSNIKNTYLEWKNRTIDILFMGQINSRRKKILDQLAEHNLNCRILENVWGVNRLDVINNSKIAINIHYYEKSILESVRLSLLLSNSVIVVSETSCDNKLDDLYSPYMILTAYNKLVEKCNEILTINSNGYYELCKSVVEFKKTKTSIPLNNLSKYCDLINNNDNKIKNKMIKCDDLDDLVVNSNDIASVKTEIINGNLIVKLDPIDNDILPSVSIVTITYNRKHLFQLPIRNFYLFDYPADKLEWIIVDDSDNLDQDLESILPVDDRIKYIKLGNRTSIGEKRNIGISKSKYNIIAFMDDDDYYYPISIYSRVSVLLNNYPKYKCVGVADIEIYDINNNSCAVFNSPHISEASMCFVKKMWIDQQFSKYDHRYGEGYLFLKNRRNTVIKMPSCFNILAITHKTNITSKNRQLNNNNVDLLKQIDMESKLFLFKLFNV